MLHINQLVIHIMAASAT